MRTGVIVYVVGEYPIKEKADIRTAVRKLRPETDRVEVVSKDAGHFDVADAWWFLTVKGMQRIFCMIGEINASGGLQLKERGLRLCG